MDFKEIALPVFSAFMVMFAIIDILGLVPILITFKRQGIDIKPKQITLIAFVIMTLALFGGEFFLNIFGVDVSSFAIAGSIVIFILSLEMTLGIKLFKSDVTNKQSVVPLAFPLIAGPGSITTLITLRAEFNIWTLMVALALNMLVVFLALNSLDRISRILGPTGAYITEKIFGIILMAIAVKIFINSTGFNNILPK